MRSDAAAGLRLVHLCPFFGRYLGASFSLGVDATLGASEHLAHGLLVLGGPQPDDRVFWLDVELAHLLRERINLLVLGGQLLVLGGQLRAQLRTAHKERVRAGCCVRAGGLVCVCVWFGAAAHMVSASLAAAAAAEGGAFSAAASVVAEDIAAAAVRCALCC